MDGKGDHSAGLTVQPLGHADLQSAPESTVSFQPHLQGLIEGPFVAGGGRLGLYPGWLIQDNQVVILEEHLSLGNPVGLECTAVAVHFDAPAGAEDQAGLAGRRYR